jgi:hypothetical protein
VIGAEGSDRVHLRGPAHTGDLGSERLGDLDGASRGSSTPARSSRGWEPTTTASWKSCTASRQDDAGALAEHPDCKAVLIVSPRYYGVCSGVLRIAGIVHEHGLPLACDDAWALAYKFHPGLLSAPGENWTICAG